MKRTLPLILAALMIFAVISLVLLKIMPGPLKDSDFLVIGSLATLAALAGVFAVIIATSKSSDVFFKRRKK